MRYYYQTFRDVGAEQWPTPNHTNFVSKGPEIESPCTPLKILSQLKYEFLIFTTKIIQHTVVWHKKQIVWSWSKSISHLIILTLNVPCISESCIEMKIKLNFCFHTSLWCLKRFYEGLLHPWLGREGLKVVSKSISMLLE